MFSFFHIVFRSRSSSYSGLARYISIHSFIHSRYPLLIYPLIRVNLNNSRRQQSSILVNSSQPRYQATYPHTHTHTISATIPTPKRARRNPSNSHHTLQPLQPRHKPRNSHPVQRRRDRHLPRVPRHPLHHLRGPVPLRVRKGAAAGQAVDDVVAQEHVPVDYAVDGQLEGFAQEAEVREGGGWGGVL